jgi:hypothetical protein
MAAVRNFSLVLDFMGIANEPLELGMLKLV